MTVNHRNQRGFTIIEVIMIIVILGILAAIAIPRFVDLTGNPRATATKHVADSLTSANVINKASCNAVNNVVNPKQCIAVKQCSDLATAIVPALILGTTGEARENIFNLEANLSVSNNGESAPCTLQYLKDGVLYTSVYTITGTGFSDSK